MGFVSASHGMPRPSADNIGFTAITTQAIWKDHPEKVCAFTEEFAAKNPKTVKAVLKALHEASVWLDKMDNRAEAGRRSSAPPLTSIAPRTPFSAACRGSIIMGDGRKLKDPVYMIFSDRNCNYPQAKFAHWWLTQLRRWGFTEGAPDYAGVAKQVMRGDLYEEAMKEIGYTHGGADDKPETLFDKVTFDPKAISKLMPPVRGQNPQRIASSPATAITSAVLLRSPCPSSNLTPCSSPWWHWRDALRSGR